jgi:hypothetical protein
MTTADIAIELQGWGSTAGNTGGLIRDVSGDGLPDFLIADIGNPANAGRVLVFW